MRRSKASSPSTSVNAILQAVLDGFGIGFLPEDMVAPHIGAGSLVQVLDDWSQPFPGLHLYYPPPPDLAPPSASSLMPCTSRAGPSPLFAPSL